PVSNDLGKTIHKVFQIPSAKIQTVTNGVNTKEFKPIPKKVAIKTLKKNLSQKVVGEGGIVGFMGEVAPWQGVETFIEAAPIVLREFPETRFLIIGGLKTNKTRQELIDKIKRKIERKGLKDSILITGQRPHQEMPLFLSLCDILTAPFSEAGYKWNYGFSPLKIFEYLAMGKPVIATDLPWIKELINNQNGLIIPPADPKALAGAICELFNNPHTMENLGINARRQAEKKLDWVVIAKQLLQIYAKML
ncbi:MAG: glycosyltransferase, partial [Candidatus Heimdallarchaeota archaeon]|nr:glycosyltransferase [Candidatus Heimdallarchaeota archaeon]